MWKRLSVFGVALAIVSVAARPAAATFPGENGRIAFRRYFNAEQTWGAVFMVKPDGSGERQVTHPQPGFVDRNPDWSPDGRRIAFERQSDNYDEIFVVNADGTGLHQLTHNPPGKSCDTGGTCNSSPAWSPDGKQIAFSRASGPIRNDLIDEVALYVMNADGSGLRQVTQKTRPHRGEDGEPQWSPNGRRLLFQRWNVRGAMPTDGVAVWTVNLVTGREHRVTPWRLRAGDTPDWSPDGRRILFHSNQGGPETVSANYYTIRPDGTGLQQLTFAQGGQVQHLGAGYSPDGKKITFARRPATGPAGNADVFTMNVDGTHIRHVTRTSAWESYPDWGTRH